MENKHITVVTDIHGRYHLTLGEHQYMYCSPSQLAAGIAYHTQVTPEGIDTDQLNFLFGNITNASETAEKFFKKKNAMQNRINNLRESNNEKADTIQKLKRQKYK